jgi:hypothetical protein
LSQGIDWSSLLNSLLQSAGQAIIAGLAGFIAAWIAFRYESRRDISKLQAELRRDMIKAQTDKRNLVVDELWRKLRVATEKASVSTAMYKQYPDFKRLSDDAVQELLDPSRLSDRQKRELLAAPDRNKYFIDVTFWLQLSDARDAVYQASAYLSDIRIYLPEPLAQTIDALLDAFHRAFISYEIWHTGPEPALMKSMRQDLKTARELYSAAEAQIRLLVSRPIEGSLPVA